MNTSASSTSCAPGRLAVLCLLTAMLVAVPVEPAVAQSGPPPGTTELPNFAPLDDHNDLRVGEPLIEGQGSSFTALVQASEGDVSITVIVTANNPTDLVELTSIEGPGASGRPATYDVRGEVGISYPFLPSQRLQAGIYEFSFTVASGASNVIALIKSDTARTDSLLLDVDVSLLVNDPSDRRLAGAEQALREAASDSYGPYLIGVNEVSIADASFEAIDTYGEVRVGEPDQGASVADVCAALPPTTERRLRIAVVDRITAADLGDESIRGVSSLNGTSPQIGAFTRDIETPAKQGRETCIVVAVLAHADTRELWTTAMHEAGHFLGLHHTSDSSGTVHDPLSSTPQCHQSADTDGNGWVDRVECGPAARNLMFWEVAAERRLTREQANVVRQHPLLYHDVDISADLQTSAYTHEGGGTILLANVGRTGMQNVLLTGLVIVTDEENMQGPLEVDIVLDPDDPREVELACYPPGMQTFEREDETGYHYTVSCGVGYLGAGESYALQLQHNYPLEIDESTGEPSVKVGGTAGGEGTLEEPNRFNNYDLTEACPCSVPVDLAAQISGSRFGPAGGFAQGQRQASHVVLATMTVFADALAGSVLTRDAPLLFARPDRLPAVTRTEIDRVLGGSGTVYLLGGSGAISDRVVQALAEAGYTPVRLDGPSRVETAIAIAEEAERLYGAPEVIAIARANSPADNPTAGWADAIAAGGWSAETGQPVLLTPTNTAHPAVESYLADRRSAEVVALGGTSAVADATLEGLGGSRRVAGDDRFATAAAIAGDLWTDTDDGFLIANGRDADAWQAALAAAGLAADMGHPMLLVEPDRLPGATDEAIGCPRPSLTLVAGADHVRSRVTEALADGC